LALTPLTRVEVKAEVEEEASLEEKGVRGGMKGLNGKVKGVEGQMEGVNGDIGNGLHRPGGDGWDGGEPKGGLLKGSAWM